MPKYFTADYILPVNSKPLPNGTVALSDQGEVIGIYAKDSTELLGKSIEKLKGILVPGFINTHTHLELAHLRGQLPQKKGLIVFIKGVLGLRQFAEEERTEAMKAADQEMYDNGIVAVGDIANHAGSKTVKEESKLHYHTFIELIGINPDQAKTVFQNGLKLKEQFAPLPNSLTPHAPYSVSKELLREIYNHCKKHDNPISIHNQETEEENKFFRYKTGQFLDLYEHLKQDISFFKPQARNSLQTFTPSFPENQPILLVHNTYTSLKDLYFVKRFNRDVYWCFCPKANLYIEDRLPKVDLFLPQDFTITLGTDSYASNDKLCILSELKTLHEHFPHLQLVDTIKWATINGAKYLGVADRFGTLEKGKKPGLNLITYTENLSLTRNSGIKKIA
ncbi:MAG: amidohydrolase family protein [Sphingobacteriaceae bacterium]